MEQADEIVLFLMNKKLILNPLVQENIVLKKLGENKKLISEDQILITGKTKALLFNIIDKLLREKYPDTMPLLYSIPIVNMDWEQADELIKETAAV
jgi:hypothetical protein